MDSEQNYVAPADKSKREGERLLLGDGQSAEGAGRGGPHAALLCKRRYVYGKEPNGGTW
jgi:hypothetical protein